jgi:hypothetical protein
MTLPSFQDISNEMQARGATLGQQMDFDGVRRDKMKAVEAITGRPLIVYAVDMANPTKTAQNIVDGMINPFDRDGFIEATRHLSGDDIDVFIQSGGGLAEAAESIVVMLRQRFKSVRFIVASSAKSAATMLSLSGDEILMTSSSELGPTDPQMGIGGGRLVPAQAVLDQFETARDQLTKNPQSMPAWLPILQQLGPSLLQECKNQMLLGQTLVADWLERYMFADDTAGGHDRAVSLAAKFSDHNRWNSHGRRIGLEWLTTADADGIKVSNIEDNQALHEAIWALHHAINVTFSSTTIFKIIEHCSGDAYLRGNMQMQMVMGLQGVPVTPQLRPQPAPLPAQQPSATP